VEEAAAEYNGQDCAGRGDHVGHSDADPHFHRLVSVTMDNRGSVSRLHLGMQVQQWSLVQSVRLPGSQLVRRPGPRNSVPFLQAATVVFSLGNGQSTFFWTNRLAQWSKHSEPGTYSVRGSEGEKERGPGQQCLG